ncbi:MAG: 4-hydroxy-3-methylbut-2-enyl diphosphate reductase [Lachnospiraceae bacterium]|nr:4-hydroxy-3-methylbut-2-enyl diphosphate reductase [Lachnospiraceae bacterium]MDE6254092.1 4-hydroxy-3-methylbut-2-enyl diphosphate reductase [Lachnospiraceae bacterium]
MEVIVAETAGFCFGVKRAVDKVYEQIKESPYEKIYTYGPIIHNEEVVGDLEKKGVSIINSKEELKMLKKGIIIIRSHGVDKEVYDIANSNNLKIVDATCPFVLKIHKIVEKEKNNGSHIIIIGNSNHPEVQGIKGWSGEDTTVIGNEEEARNFSMEKPKKICIVSQTTFNYNKFKYLVEIISKKRYDINVLDTICNATHERQAEAKKIAANVDSMIVIGGKNSSNTQKLYEICSKECSSTYYIQTLEDMNLCELQSSSCVGITAGASTPNYIIEEVHNNVRKF